MRHFMLRVQNTILSDNTKVRCDERAQVFSLKSVDLDSVGL